MWIPPDWFSEPYTEPKIGFDPGSTEPVSRPVFSPNKMIKFSPKPSHNNKVVRGSLYRFLWGDTDTETVSRFVDRSVLN